MKRILAIEGFLIVLLGFLASASASNYITGDAGPWTIGVKDNSYGEMGNINVSYENHFAIGDPDEGLGGLITHVNSYAQIRFELKQSGWYFIYHDGYFAGDGVIKYFSVDPTAPWTEDPPTEDHDLLALRYGAPGHSIWRILKIPVFLKSGTHVLRIYGASQGDPLPSILNDFVALYEMPHLSPPWQIGIQDNSTTEYYFQQHYPLPDEATPEEKDALNTSYQPNLSEFVVGQDWVTEFGGWIHYNDSDIHFLLSADEARIDYILTLDPYTAGTVDAAKTIDVAINGTGLGSVTFNDSVNPDPIEVEIPAQTLAAGNNTLKLVVNPTTPSAWLAHFSWDAIALQPDCNGNGVPDGDDIAADASLDLDGNGVPDVCQCPSTVVDACAWISADADDLIDGDGCDPTDDYKSHGQYVKCVAHFANEAVQEFQACFEPEQLQEIQCCVVSEKARSDIGK